MNLDMCENLYADGTSAAPVLGLRARRRADRHRQLRPGRKLDLGHRVLPERRRGLPDVVPGLAVLRRLLARVHLGDEEGHQRASGPHQDRDVRQPRHLPGRPEGGAERGPVLRRHRLRADPPHHATPGSDNRAPTAHIQASPTYGPAPLEVGFDASGSTDPDGDTLTYAWDLDGDGQYDDSTEVFPQRTYAAGPHDVSLKVTDPQGAFHSDTVTDQLGRDAPERLDRRADRRAPLARRADDQLLRLRDRRAGRPAAGLRAVVEAGPEPLRHRQRLPLAPACRTTPAWRAARSSRPTTATRPT